MCTLVPQLFCMLCNDGKSKLKFHSELEILAICTELSAGAKWSHYPRKDCLDEDNRSHQGKRLICDRESLERINETAAVCVQKREKGQTDLRKMGVCRGFFFSSSNKDYVESAVDVLTQVHLL